MRKLFKQVALATVLGLGGVGGVSLAFPALGAEMAAVPANPASSEEGVRLHALFDADWQWRISQFPEWATTVGENRYNDRLTDLSEAALQARKQYELERLQQIRAIDRSRLSPVDQVSYDIFLYEADLAVRWQKFPLEETLQITNINGIHIEFPEVVQSTPLNTAGDYRNYIARITALPQHVDQIIALMKKGMAGHWVVFRAAMQPVPEQIDAQIKGDIRASALYQPFAKIPDEIPASQRSDLAGAGYLALEQSYVPAMRKLRDFIVNEYLPASPVDGALSSRPDGVAAYQLHVEDSTTTHLGYEELHQIGLKEVARIHQEMEDTIRETGFHGDFAAFVKRISKEKRFFYKSANDLLSGYRDIAKRVDPELPKLFAELPRTPYGIRPIPAYQGESVSEYYSEGAADGSRPGWFNANVVALSHRPTWEMEALFLHEAVPGHHMQVSRAKEMGDLPAFRRNNWYTAYGEGWALYAEGLGKDLGLYTNSYTRFGRYRMEIFRAARLVVDTGIHAKGWTRTQAIDWMTKNTGMARADIVSEVDRYYVWPGQALAYKTGEMKILSLRSEARAALGDRFDIRRFHNAILDIGAVPLETLDTHMHQWIASEKAKPQS